MILYLVIGIIIIGGTGFYLWIKQFIKNERFMTARDWVMFKVSIPKEIRKQGPEQSEAKEQEWKEMLSVAEQLFSSFAGLYVSGIIKYGVEHFKRRIIGQDWVSCEIIAKDGKIFFYVGCTEKNKQYILKQIYSFYPYAFVEETKDYKIFDADSKYAFETYKLEKNSAYPIRTYKHMETDPINAITNIMGKISPDDKISFQILLRPNSGAWRDECGRICTDIKTGNTNHSGGSILGKFINTILHGITSSIHTSNQPQASQSDYRQLTPVQEETMKLIREKGSKIGFDAQIRVMAVSKTTEQAKANIGNIYSALAPYSSAEGNAIVPLTVFHKSKFVSRFILREFSRAYSVLNTEELASIFHFPNKFTETPNIHWKMAKTLAPPTNLPSEGIILGKSVYRGEEKMVRLMNDDRRRHLFMIGKTGVGKTTLFINMIEQDIKAGRGCCFIDPLGDAVEQILQLIPKERAEDVILFDPSDTSRPMGLNLLEWERPEDKDFLVAEWLEIFYKLFDPNKTGIVGPQFEHWGRNASLTVMAQPGGGTLIEIPQLFSDDDFREKCVANVKDPVVLSFWNKQMAKTADFHKSEMFNYFISKFGRFMTNDLMRNIIGQQKSSFNFRHIMDEGKILLVNLSKGKIGETNSALLGMILVSKLQVAAFSRANLPEEQRKDFYLYIDEFQNFTTNTFKTILSEARKYHLNLNITNQYIAQLTEDIRDAVIGNAGTLISYRIGAADAEFMEKEFTGIGQQDLTNLEFANMYVKLLVGGTPTVPFSMRGIKTASLLNKDLGQSIRELSRLKYGQDKMQVEASFRSRMDIESANSKIEQNNPPRES